MNVDLTTRQLRTEFMVVGLSPAGVAAALELARLGKNVCLVVDEDDSSIDEAAIMEESPLSAAGMWPYTWAQDMLERLKTAHVAVHRIHQTLPFRTEGDTGWLLLEGQSWSPAPTRWQFAGINCPSGTGEHLAVCWFSEPSLVSTASPGHSRSGARPGTESSVVGGVGFAFGTVVTNPSQGRLSLGVLAAIAVIRYAT